MKRLILIGISASLFAFNMVENKIYNCKTVAVSLLDKNQTKTIPVNKATEKVIKNSLNIFYTIKSKRIKNNVSLNVGNIDENFTYFRDFKGYAQYLNSDKSLVFIVDKNISTQNAALVIPNQKMMIFYNCK